ncbi:hypothetical protein BBP40_007539 [Aspergillus hancockii]|nr:hypothetical protein BBP40_007539 [Aspergillus hancockii]
MSAGRELCGGYFTTKHHSTTYDYISPLKLDLAGKYVLITGAAWENGIGYATAFAFARAGGLKLAAAQGGRLGPVVLSCAVDIARQDSVQAMYDTVSQGFDGRLDIVVNNAAHMGLYKPILDSDPDTY